MLEIFIGNVKPLDFIIEISHKVLIEDGYDLSMFIFQKFVEIRLAEVEDRVLFENFLQEWCKDFTIEKIIDELYKIKEFKELYKITII